jgi:predicted dehydrogenase
MNIALLGHGSVAQLHADAIRDIGGHVVSAVLGRTPPEAIAFRRHWPSVRATDRIEEALRGADVAIVCSPTPVHVQQARAAIEAGVAVLVELPAATTAPEATALGELALVRDVLLVGTHTSRWLPAVQRLATLLAEGAIGGLQSITLDRHVAARQRSWSDDPLLHHGQHAVDVIRSWGLPVRPVSLRTEVVDGRPRSASFVLDVGDGATARVSITHGAPANDVELVVTGSRAKLSSDGFGSVRRTSAGAAWRTVLDIDTQAAYRSAVHDQDVAFLAAAAGGPATVPWSETVANLRVIDRLRALESASDKTP